MIATTAVVVDRFEPIEKELIAVAEIQKRSVMHKELDAGLWSDGAGGVAIVPYQPDKTAEIRNDDIGDTKVVIDERRRTSEPKIATIVDEIVV